MMTTDNHTEILQQIAELVLQLPHDERPSSLEVSFGVDTAMTAALVELGAATTTNLYASHDEVGPYAIDSARLWLGDVHFVAQTDGRTATTVELARLEARKTEDA